MAKAKKSPKPGANDRKQKIDYLMGLYRDGKATNPTEAHAALKARFGRSLPFGDVGTILGGGDPTQPRTGKKAKKKPGRKPERPATERPATGRKRGRPGRPRKSEGARYAIMTSSGEVELATSRSEMVSSVQGLLDRGRTPEDLTVFERVDLKVGYTISV